MRRPMVFCGMLFSLLLLLFLQLRPLWWSEGQRLPEKTVCMEGNLYEKEYRIRSGKKVPVLRLEDVFIYDVMPESDGRAGGSLPGENPYYNAGTGQVMKVGYDVMCYMKSEGSLPRLGSRVLVRGKIKNFKSATNEGEFDSARYYQILGVGASVQECELVDVQGEGSTLRNRLYGVKEYAGLMLHAVLDGEDASVMGALLLGESALIDKDTKDLYKRSGIIHILAISGLHISLIGMGVFRLLKRCRMPVGICAGAASAVVFLFSLMTGFGPSSLRAIIMFLLQMTAHFLGRTYDLATGLSVAAISVLSMQPLYLYHSGFMLSFLSVASLVVLNPVLEDVVPRRIAPGMAIFIGTLPVHAWFYYEAAPYALLLNLLVVPCMPVLMVFGGILLLAGALWLPLAGVPAWGIHLLLWFYKRASDISLKIPGHDWIIGKPAAFQVILYLTILVILIFVRESMPKMWCRMVLGLAVLILVSDLHTGVQVISVDVGQGDCYFVTDHRGTNLLIDGGSSSKKNVGEYQIEPVLKCNGVKKLDAVFISHLDQDHYNGILELIGRSDEGGVGIGRIFVSEAVGAEDKLQELTTLASEHGIPVEVMPQGAVYRNGKVELACLYPPGRAGSEYADGESRNAEAGVSVAGGSYYSTDNTNENSMVLFMRYGEFTALFTGDLETGGEECVLQYCRNLLGDRPLTVLKVAHHGSRTSTSVAFLETLHPEIAMISAGQGNSYGHPHEEILSRLQEAGTRVFRTDEIGEITVSVRRGKVAVEGYGR